MQRTLISTSDGSHTLFVDELNETYHSTHGAVQEAMHVFVQKGLQWKEAGIGTELAILEVGFGTGLNAWLTAIHAKDQINYVGIEAFPVEQELLDALNYADSFPEHRDIFKALCSAEWGSSVDLTERFNFKKLHTKIQDADLGENLFDLVYFDAFGPAVQKEMWSIEVLAKLYAALKEGGALVTYCAQGQFRRDLKALGFVLEALPGPPGKREMTRAVKVQLNGKFS